VCRGRGKARQTDFLGGDRPPDDGLIPVIT
jgi:hypothetical protein